jgi:hypothetical protein
MFSLSISPSVSAVQGPLDGSGRFLSVENARESHHDLPRSDAAPARLSHPERGGAFGGLSATRAIDRVERF